MTQLRAQLNALEAHMADNHPDWLNALYPGLEPAGIAAVTAVLRPYQLPAEVVALYQWRNGQSDADTFVPGYTFLPLAEAVALYRELLALGIGWHATWFPVFNFEGDSFVIILGRQEAASTPVWRCDNEETHLFLWHDSLVAMVQTMVACFREGIYVDAGGYWDAEEAQETAVRLRYSPHAHNWEITPDPATAVSRFDEDEWPAEWMGSEAGEAPVESTAGTPSGKMSIAAYLTQQPAGIITLQGRVTQLVGSPKETFVRLADETGTIPLYVQGPLARKLRMRKEYLLQVEAGTQQHAFFRDPSLATRFVIKKIL